MDSNLASSLVLYSENACLPLKECSGELVAEMFSSDKLRSKMPPGPARLECQVIDGFYAFSTTPSGRTILTERMEVLV